MSALSPWAKLPEWLLATFRSAAGAMVVAADTLAGEAASPPPDTWTVSLPEAAALLATLATTVIGGSSPFSPASTSLR